MKMFLLRLRFLFFATLPFQIYIFCYMVHCSWWIRGPILGIGIIYNILSLLLVLSSDSNNDPIINTFSLFMNYKKIKDKYIGDYYYRVTRDDKDKFKVIVYQDLFYMMEIGNFHHRTYDNGDTFTNNISTIIEKVESELKTEKFNYDPTKFDGFVSKEERRLNKLNKL